MPNQDPTLNQTPNNPSNDVSDSVVGITPPIPSTTAVNDTPSSTISDIKPLMSVASLPTDTITESPPPPIVIPAEVGNAPASMQPLSGVPTTGTDQSLPPLNVSPVVVTGGSGGDLGKKVGRKGLIVTVLGLFLLVGGIGAGLYLTKQPQDIREKANIGQGTDQVVQNCTYQGKTFKIKINAISESPSCPHDAGTTKNQISSYSTTFKIETDLKNLGFNITGKYMENSDYCYEPYGHTDPRYPGSPVCLKNEIQNEKIINLNSENNYEQSFTISRTSPSGKACGSYQFDSWFTSIDQCPEFTPPAPGTYGEDKLTYGSCLTGYECSETSSFECKEIRAYKVTGDITDPTTWTKLLAADLKLLKKDDIIYITAVGGSTDTVTLNGGFDRAEFTVNSAAPVESTNIKPKAVGDTSAVEYYYKYTIPTNSGTFVIKARLHHATSGWM